MFLDKIDNYESESSKLKLIYKQDCLICNGTGLKPSNGGSGYSTCDCAKKANIQARLLCNSMPKKYIGINWDNLTGFENDAKIISNLKTFCNEITNNMCNGSNIFILGEDKIKIMELCCVIANDLAYKKNYSGYFHNVLFVTTEDLMQTVYTVKNNYEQKAKLQKAVTNVDVLIVNYLGEETENRSEQTSKYLNDLFVQRAFNEKLNIVSSSLGVEDIANKYGKQFINTIKSSFKLIRLSDLANSTITKAGEDENGYY